MTYQLLLLARELENEGISAEVVHVPTIKPLDEETILESVRKTGRVVTAEEAQAAAGFGGAVTELLSEKLPVPVKRLGMQDHFGESGTPEELLDYFNLSCKTMLPGVAAWVRTVPQYRQGF
jgi:transketolase